MCASNPVRPVVVTLYVIVLSAFTVRSASPTALVFTGGSSCAPSRCAPNSTGRIRI
jgi:hypothetical protein